MKNHENREVIIQGRVRITTLAGILQFIQNGLGIAVNNKSELVHFALETLYNTLVKNGLLDEFESKEDAFRYLRKNKMSWNQDREQRAIIKGLQREQLSQEFGSSDYMDHKETKGQPSTSDEDNELSAEDWLAQEQEKAAKFWEEHDEHDE